jgi:cobalt/nickel transport system ATP-binding protein
VFEVEEVCYSYPGGPLVLRDIGFSVRTGESVAVLGANASGKSTLLHLLDGLYFPTRGRVAALGRELTEESVETPPFSREFRQQVGFLFQNSDAQLFCSTVDEELAFGPLQLRLPHPEVERRVNDILTLLEIERLRQRSPHELSEGEKRKVALGSVLTCAPRVLLLDEPSAGLDPRTRDWLVDFVGALHREKATLVIATHDLSLARELSERAIVLSEDHRLVRDAPTSEVLDNRELLLSVNLVGRGAARSHSVLPQDARLSSA